MSFMGGLGLIFRCDVDGQGGGASERAAGGEIKAPWDRQALGKGKARALVHPLAQSNF